MAKPIEEFSTRLDELKSDLNFVRTAAKLRPRIGHVMNYQAEAEALKLATDFMSEKRSRPEGLIAALFVRVIAAFERYLRKLVETGVENINNSAATYDGLSSAIKSRNLAFTGRIISAIDNPKDYLILNYEDLISNLASCRVGAESFRLNAMAFSAAVIGSTPEAVERALKSIEVEEWWDHVGADKGLQTMLGTRKPRDTANRAQEKLKELTRWRNQVAHGGDEEVSLTEDQLERVIDFLRQFAICLDSEVAKQLAAS